MTYVLLYNLYQFNIFTTNNAIIEGYCFVVTFLHHLGIVINNKYILVLISPLTKLNKILSNSNSFMN